MIPCKTQTLWNERCWMPGRRSKIVATSLHRTKIDLTQTLHSDGHATILPWMLARLCNAVRHTRADSRHSTYIWIYPLINGYIHTVYLIYCMISYLWIGAITVNLAWTSLQDSLFPCTCLCFTRNISDIMCTRDSKSSSQFPRSHYNKAANLR